MKNALNNQVVMLGDMFFWLVANLKQGVRKAGCVSISYAGIIGPLHLTLSKRKRGKFTTLSWNMNDALSGGVLK